MTAESQTLRRLRWWGVALAAGVAYLLGSWSGPPEPKHPTQAATQPMLTCSMHPQVRQTEGACPICGMQLVPLAQGQSPSSEPTRLVHVPEGSAEIEMSRVDRLDRSDERTNLVGRVAPFDAADGMRSAKRRVDLIAFKMDTLHVGESVFVTPGTAADDVFHGRITSIEGHFDPNTQTRHVSADVSDPAGVLQPRAVVEARVVEAPDYDVPPLVVPRSAVMFAGRRSVVYVRVSDGGTTAYESRIVHLAPPIDGVYPVLSGLTDGELVVTRGAFTLDASLQLQGGLSLIESPDDIDFGELEVEDVHREDEEEDEEDRQFGYVDRYVTVPSELHPVIATITESYLEMQYGLAHDSLDPVHRAAIRLRDASRRIRPPTDGAFGRAWWPLTRHLQIRGEQLSTVEDLEQARLGFHELSPHIVAMLQTFGNHSGSPLRVAHCPMAFANKGASWVQAPREVENPYFGAKMFRCGTIRATVSTGSYLPIDPEVVEP